jgi:hypothetical protein
MARFRRTSLLLLALTAVIIFLVIAWEQGELTALWERLAPSEPDIRETIEMPHLFPGQ